jgi:hypothetical protein
MNDYSNSICTIILEENSSLCSHLEVDAFASKDGNDVDGNWFVAAVDKNRCVHARHQERLRVPGTNGSNRGLDASVREGSNCRQ